MNAEKRSIPKPAIIAALVVGLALYGALGYFLLIGPKRAEATELDAEIAEVEGQLTTMRALAAAAGNAKQEPIKVADLFHLTKAMPNDEDISGVLLEVNKIAREAGITFSSIRPGVPVAQGAYRVLPIDVFFDGNFYALTDFLYRLRNLVTIEGGELTASGRLFAVDSVDFDVLETEKDHIIAKLVIDAYMYGTGPSADPSAAPPAGEAPPSTDGTTPPSTDAPSTTEPPTTTEPTPVPAEAGATAAGASP